MSAILIAVCSVTTVGLICAVLLTITSHFMSVTVDERLAQIQEYMPGANCGACGFPGCSAYAQALLSGAGVKANLCTPGGSELVERISAILGVNAEGIDRKTAHVHCRGDCHVQKRKMDYIGLKSCAAVKQLFSGEGACAFGCLGYGDCQKVCPSDAICMDDSLAKIRIKACIGCGLCVKACPNKLISLVNSGIIVSVLCENIEKGAIVRKKCLNGCIACGKCVRECPSAAIVIEDNLARIDYKKCTGCGHCVSVCVTGSIQRITPLPVQTA